MNVKRPKQQDFSVNNIFPILEEKKKGKTTTTTTTTTKQNKTNN
jgi:hypothetical protein